ncbi:MAG: hypothetical protein HF314_18805 [Ignavibacteria bacterium]|jgi:hypothetical protein|nr:hypothetical protein [Ignavibacteria bacterium]MCU7505140.1 hypothetical protein [Ignavibacteria bacterium]MCU7518008.1 hypothetical protein [Ignavibacteria bacterium]
MTADETRPGDFKNVKAVDPTKIKGWGIDANPDNDPTYPMKLRTDEEQRGYSWERPEQQAADVEVLHSVERPNLTAVFGTSVPPSGLSGMLRRFAFKYSESSYGHWLPLMLADRINAVEGIIDDIGHGHVPNIFAERGYKADWKYNRTEFILKTAAAVAVSAGIVAMMMPKKKRKAWYQAFM